MGSVAGRHRRGLHDVRRVADRTEGRVKADCYPARRGTSLCAICHEEIPSGVTAVLISGGVDETGGRVEPLALCIECCDGIATIAAEPAPKRAAVCGMRV